MRDREKAKYQDKQELKESEEGVGIERIGEGERRRNCR